jgi:hypothetical protein
MNLKEACKSAREGNFVSHHSFDYNESMHEYNGDLYYEDGANLTVDGFIDTLEHEEWSREGWFIKYSKEQVNKQRLRELHTNNKGRMLNYNESYENCIIH